MSYKDKFSSNKPPFGTPSQFTASHERFRRNVIGFILLVFVMIISIWITVGYFVSTEISENGGVKNTIIKAGKEVKDIHNQIMEDD
jgi:hypothetical protein